MKIIVEKEKNQSSNKNISHSIRSIETVLNETN